MSIRLKLTIMFLSIAVIPLLLVSALTFTNYRNSLETNRLSHLRDITAYKADKIETYFTGVKSNIKIAQSLYNIKKNLPVLLRFSDDPNNPEFQVSKKQLGEQLYQMQSVLSDVSDIMLVNPEGKVVYTNKSGHYSKDMSNGIDTEQKAFTEGKDRIYFSDIYFDKAEDNRFEMLITAPASDFNGAFIGVIAFEVDMTTIYKLVQDVTGLGNTGETLIGKKTGSQVIFLNPLRHDPNAALVRIINIGDKTGIGIQKAVQETGAGQYIDYRGKKVVGAWRYIPSLDWGMVAKIDADEAFADVTNLRNLSIVILLIVIVLSGIMAFSIAHSISEPIKRLSEGAQIVGSGNLDYKLGTGQRDEIGQLSRSFDKMTLDLKQTTASRDELNREINERKKAEEALRKSHDELEMRVKERTVQLTEAVETLTKTEKTIKDERQRLFDVLETLPVYVVLLTEDYHVPFANRFFEERFGKSNGQRCYEYLFNRREPCEICETYTILKTNKPHHWEWTGPNGRNYDIYDYPFTDTDGSRLIMEMGIDITEQKRAQEVLRSASLYSRSLIEASLDPLVTISSEGKITDVNKATELVTGAAREQLIGTDFLNYFTEPEKAREGYQQVFAQGFVTDYPLTIRHRDGRLTDVIYNATVYKNEAGEVQGVFAAARDITEKKAVEAELEKYRHHLEELVQQRTSQLEAANVQLQAEITERKQAEKDLKRSNENLEQFAFVASHDLQEPLRMMASYSALLERRYKDKLDANADVFINFIVDGAKRMQRLINDLLAYSRVGLGDRQVEEIGCNFILERVITNMMAAIEESKAVITYDELPRLMGNESNLIQLFQNLIGNAIKFHGPEAPRVHVGAVRHGDEWLFSVRDNGIGIEPQYKDRIFLIFQRLHGRDQYPGTGIGLSICKKIVETQGGRIWVESEQGKGSTFYFAIPAKKEAKSE